MAVELPLRSAPLAGWDTDLQLQRIAVVAEDSEDFGIAQFLEVPQAAAVAVEVPGAVFPGVDFLIDQAACSGWLLEPHALPALGAAGIGPVK